MVAAMDVGVHPPLLSSFRRLESYARLYSGGSVRISHDETHLACPCDQAIHLLSLATGKLSVKIVSPSDEFSCLAMNPTRAELVGATRSRQIHHFALDMQGFTSALLRSWKAHKMPMIDLAYDPSGTLVASASADSSVMVFDVDKGFCTHVFRGHEGVVHRGARARISGLGVRVSVRVVRMGCGSL